MLDIASNASADEIGGGGRNGRDSGGDTDGNLGHNDREGQQRDPPHAQRNKRGYNNHSVEADRVLHGVSAAMASRALPRQQPAAGDTNRQTTWDKKTPGSVVIGENRLELADHERRLGYLLEGGDDGRQAVEGGRRREGRAVGSSASAEWDVSADNGVIESSSQVDRCDDDDDGRMLARKQIDQALRERALRRRHRLATRSTVDEQAGW